MELKPKKRKKIRRSEKNGLVIGRVTLVLDRNNGAASSRHNVKLRTGVLQLCRYLHTASPLHREKTRESEKARREPTDPNVKISRGEEEGGTKEDMRVWPLFFRVYPVGTSHLRVEEAISVLN